MNKKVTGAEISHPISANATTQLREIRKNLPLRVLSEDDWQHWITRGYVIVKNAISAEAAKRLEDVLWEFDAKDPNDPLRWYEPERRPHVRPELNNVGMTEIYHHQYMWDNRMTQRVYDAFVDIWDREDLWVAIDRSKNKISKQVGFKRCLIFFKILKNGSKLNRTTVIPFVRI